MKKEQIETKIELPKEFLERMKEMLKEEFPAFLKTYKEEKIQGLRVNTLKITRDKFLEIAPFSLEEIKWTENGFFYSAKDRPGKHPYHQAGLYYMQEPSAMAAAEALEAKPQEKILDLCAAPGGKTTQIAASMKGEGLLLSNEIHPARAKILAQNVERMGIQNAIVTNETAKHLSEKFPAFFDRILVDAPCSGEGMFRKDEMARKEWSLENVEMCKKRQLEILEDAAIMLKKGGRLVYSTCTFSPQENEEVIKEFLEKHREFEIQENDFEKGVYLVNGKLEWGEKGQKDFLGTYRLWPHFIKGEGHFIAILTKIEGIENRNLKKGNVLKERKLLDLYEDFKKKYSLNIKEGFPILFGEQFYFLPEESFDMTGLKVIRPGWHIGSFRKNRFEPSHALALSLNKENFKNTISFSAHSREIMEYLKGETISLAEKKQLEKGWCLIEVDGYSLGFGKVNNQMIKNHYPKGLR